MSSNRHERGTTIAGTSMGGKYAISTRTDNDSGVLASLLQELGKDWGSVDVHAGSKTPWGPAQHIDRVAAGIAVVGTAGHGGVKLSPERNLAVPAEFRQASGWYEEDLEYHIPCLVFPEELAYGEGAEYTHQQAQEQLKEYYPDEWEAMTKEKVTADESRTVALREWKDQHSGQPIVASAVAADSDPGWVRVTASIRGGESDEYLVPKEEYDLRDRLGFAVDPECHPKLPPREPQPHDVAPREARAFDFTEELAKIDSRSPDGLALTKDLTGRWRDPNSDKVRTLAVILREEGVVECRTHFSKKGHPTYGLNGANNTFIKVSKTTYDFLGSQIPDGTKESTKLSAQRDKAREKADRLRTKAHTPSEWDAVRTAQQKVDQLHDAAWRASEAEREAWSAAHGTYGERAALEKHVQIQRERSAIAQLRNRVTA